MSGSDQNIASKDCIDGKIQRYRCQNDDPPMAVPMVNGENVERCRSSQNGVSKDRAERKSEV